jgi:hypothetical protein
MVEKIRQQADELGITQLRKTILYGHPTKTRQTFGMVVPNTDRAMRDYLRQFDPSAIDGRTIASLVSLKKKPVMTYYLIAPQIKVYIEDIDSLTAWAHKPLSHALKITIFSDNDEYIRGIANTLNQLWDGKIFDNIIWKKIEKVYNVKKEDCIATWKALL